VTVSRKSGEIARSGLLVSAPQGRSGKTMVSLALCAILTRRGLTVQPFKKGPDYIDPSWLTAAAGRDCRNLDLFFMREETLLASFQRACQGADFTLIEGAMGLYDGLDSGLGSTAHLARLLNVPVVLVVNTSRMTGSIAAMVTGYQHFQPDITIAGVILNNVSGNRHERKLTAAVEEYCRIPVVGSIPRHTDLHMTERHLGLIPFPETGESESVVERISQSLEPHLDIDNIMSIASSFEAPIRALSTSPKHKTSTAKIGVILDRVFNFYYPENLQALGQIGAELIFIDSLKDRLPEIDGLYIGGGFPEFFLEELEANYQLRRDVADAIERGLPVYAECAGLMYLCRGILWQGRWHEMVGVVPAEVEISQRPQGHGYVEAEVTGENPLFPMGMTLRGHEFHHSRLSTSSDLGFAYRLKRGHGIDGEADGIIYKNVFAAYTHLHALGTPEWAEAFISLAYREKKNRLSVSALAG
jgi:cobyrinic acid a,c-diamide synthase